MKKNFELSFGTTESKLEVEHQRLLNEFGQSAAKEQLLYGVLYALSAKRFGIVKKLSGIKLFQSSTIGDASLYITAKLMVEDGSPEHALDLLSVEPSTRWSRLGRAEALIAKKRMDDAIAELEYCCESGEDGPFELRRSEVLALAQIGAGRIEAASSILHASLSKWPNDAVLHWIKGNIARSTGDHAEAVNCFLEAIELDPNLRPAFSALTPSLANASSLSQRAIGVLEAAHAKTNTNAAVGALHRAYEAAGLITKATQLNRGATFRATTNKTAQTLPSELTRNKLPRLDFIIAGAKKCGTTSLFGWLGKHPKALLPHTKEIGFFSNRFANGKDWYLSHFPAASDSHDFFTGEASPGYFGRTATCCDRIHATLDFTRIILMLRNPSDRTISEYYQRKKERGQSKSMREAIDQWIESADALESDLDSLNPILVSKYARRVRHWMDTFGPENCLVVNADRLFANPEQEMKAVWTFLDVAPWAIKYPVANRGSYTTNKEYSDARRYLCEVFRPSVAELEEILGVPMDWL